VDKKEGNKLDLHGHDVEDLIVDDTEEDAFALLLELDEIFFDGFRLLDLGGIDFE